MNKVIKKAVSVLLIAFMVFGSAPLAGFVGLELPGFNFLSSEAEAADYYTYTVSDSSATIINCDTSIGGSITIPSILGGYPVTNIGDYAFSSCSEIISITIPDSVTSIGAHAFEHCKKLESVVILDGLTSIGDFAFSECSSLTSITIPDSVTSISDYAFCNCSSLTSVTLPSSVKSIGEGTFSSCCNLINILISDSVTSISDYAFYDCSSLESIMIPDSVTSIGDSAFSGCSSLTNITIPDGVASIGAYAFGYCKSLTRIIIPDGVTNIGSHAFYSCPRITSITIPESVESVGDYAFYTTVASTIYYEGSVEQWQKISIGKENVAAIENIVYNSDSDSPYFGGGTCGENLTWKLYTNGELVISGTGDMNNYTKYIMNDISLCGVPWYSVKDKIKTVTIGDDITSIGDFAFVDCINLKGIAIPDTITSIGRNAFSNCSSLTSIAIPDRVTNIGSYAFSGCSSLTSIAIPDRVTNIGSYAFSGCSSLTSISIPDSVTSIGAHAFEYCSKLQSIVIPDGITRIEDYTFQYCYGLKNVTIPVSVTNIGYWAFAACVGIESANYAGSSERWKNVTVGSENYELTNELVFESNSERPYYGAGDCGENLTWKLYTDGELVISGTGDMTDWIWEEWLSNTNAPWAKKRGKIENITIENGVTNIGNYAFSSCNSIIQVTIPENIKSIDSNAFSNCANLEKVEILSYSVEIADNAFSNSPNVVLYCKSGSTVQSYAELNNIMYVLLDGPTADFAVKNNQLVAYKGNSANPKIPSGVTSIGANAFKGNETITKLELPASVTSIFSGAFSNCSALEEIFIPHTVTTIAADTFDGTNAKIVCYANSTAHQFAVDNGIDFELVKVILNETALVLKVGEYSIITATPEQEYISSAEMSWKSSDTSVATVDENGKVTAKNNGAVIISAIAPNGATLATCSVNVIPNEYKVSWIVEGNTTTQTYEVGEAITAPANPSKSGYKFVGWTPSVPPRMPAYNLMFTAVFEASSPVKADVINPPTQTTISYGDAIILHVDESKVPAGGRVEWAADNGNFSCSANGLECKIKPEKSGSTTITATIYDANGNAVSYDNQEMTSKAGFFDKLVAFFKGLFGLTKTIER